MEYSGVEFYLYISTFFQFCGLINFNPKTRRVSKARIVLIILIAILISIVFSVFVVHRVQTFQTHPSKAILLSTVNNILIFGCDSVNSILALGSALCGHKKMNSVTDILRRIDRFLLQSNTVVKFHKSWWQNRVIIFGFWVSLSCLFESYVYARFYIGQSFSVLILKYLTFMVWGVNFCFFLTIVAMLKRYFEEVNNQVIILTQGAVFKTIGNKEIFRRLKMLRITHMLLRELSQMENDYHGFQIGLLYPGFVGKIIISTYFITITNTPTLKKIWKRAPSQFLLFNNIMYFFFIIECIGLCFLVLDAIVSAKNEGNRTVELLHKLQLEVDGSYNFNYIKSFASQLDNQRIGFSGFGIIPLDFSLLCLIICSYCKYTVIMLQFHFGKKILNST